QKGSIEYWLTERYRLYTTNNNRDYYEDIRNSPWTLQRAEAEIQQNTVPGASGLILPNTSALPHYAQRQHVLYWPLHR
ncbi:DUF2071 domain-containing protein, partial [Bacillus paralicheniformis]|uniref:DUF2071 domain-containing protein n=1 Tax=Bacillus paralicheniformis TaxID=1648923 RepID=UPI002846DF7A